MGQDDERMHRPLMSNQWSDDYDAGYLAALDHVLELFTHAAYDRDDVKALVMKQRKTVALKEEQSTAAVVDTDEREDDDGDIS